MQFARLKVRALMALSPGRLKFDLLLEPLPPDTIRILDGVPEDVPLDLVPMDLRSLGSRFVIVYEPWGQVVAVEREGSSLKTPSH
jgi:hypothetical protein